MLYREIIAVCFQIHTKHINTLCGENVELLNVKPSGTYSDHRVTNQHWLAGRPFTKQLYHMALRGASCVATLPSASKVMTGSPTVGDLHRAAWPKAQESFNSYHSPPHHSCNDMCNSLWY